MFGIKIINSSNTEKDPNNQGCTYQEKLFESVSRRQSWRIFTVWKKHIVND